MFIFCVDNHPSMGRERASQHSGLDMSKAAIEAFLGVYGKHQGQMANPVPLMLLESGQDKSCILSHITDPLPSFENKVKNYTVPREEEDQEQEDPVADEAGSNGRGKGKGSGKANGAVKSSSVSKSKTPPTNFSYSVSLAFSILNKVRIKNETDRLGYGRCPWSLEPASIFLFTNGNPQNSHEFELFTRWKTLSEYVNQIYKWDHRVFLFVMFNQDGRSSTVPSHLASLCATTGGEVFICRTMKEAHESAKNLSTRLLTSHPSVAVKLTVVDNSKGETIGGEGEADGGDVGDSGVGGRGGMHQTADVGLAARLVIKSVGEWPIPEQGWIDIRDTNGRLPIRDPIPVISVVKGASPAVAASKALLQLAKDLDVHPDTYELTMNGGRALDLDKNETYPVFIRSSWRGSVAADGGGGGGIGGGGGTLNAADPSLSSTSSCPPEPFGVLSSGSKTGVYQLTLLPFNYPKLLPLLKQVLEPLKAGKTPQDVNMQPWMSQWRNDVTAYLQSVPPYYYPPMARLLKKHQVLKLAFPGNQQNVLDYELHRKPSQRIKRAQNEAYGDITSMEIVARDRLGTKPPQPHANIIALATSAHAQQALPVGASTWAMPKTVSDIHESDLLSVWEKMRQSIFGGGSGLTVRGLSVPGIVGTSGRAPAAGQGLGGPVDSGDDWIQTACGGSRAPRETTRDMSNYFAVLARQECLRDPSLLDSLASEGGPPQDEDSELGVLKRKLSPPNFGNRYGGKKAAKTGMEIEGIVGPIALPTDIGKHSTPLSLLEETANVSVHALFMDTPAPYLEDDYLQSMDTDGDGATGAGDGEGQSEGSGVGGGGGKRDDMDVSSDGKPSSTAAETTASGNVPKIGKALKRPPRPHSLPFAARDKNELAGVGIAGAAVVAAGVAAAAAGAAATGTTAAASSALAPAATVSTPTTGSVDGETSTSKSPTSVTANLGQSPSSSPVPSSPSPSAPGSPANATDDVVWVKHYSEKHQRPYWFNSASGKSVWSDPANGSA